MDDGIVTGEGVLLDARPASVVSRLLGALVDLAALAVLAILAAIILARTGLTSEAAARIVTVIAMATVMVLLPVTVETLTRGRSLGKLVVGIRIVRDDGGPVVLRQALVRALVGTVELWITAGVVALISSMVHPRGKRLGDVLAGTYAVRVRGAAPVRRPVPMPPHLAVWARGADMARLPDGLALSVRQFLARAARLHPASRVALGSSLVGEVQRYVSPLPPVGTHPEDFLAAVLAERRERELAAELRANARAAADAGLVQRLPHGVPDPAS